MKKSSSQTSQKFIFHGSGHMKIDLRGTNVQVIVKLANIELTPEMPEYPGGVWHVEGMENENIVASGIYYYISENITSSLLGFRAAVGDPSYEVSFNHFLPYLIAAVSPPSRTNYSKMITMG